MKINYWKQTVFLKTYSGFLTQLVSFIAIMESQSYRTFISVKQLVMQSRLASLIPLGIFVSNKLSKSMSNLNMFKK